MVHCGHLSRHCSSSHCPFLNSSRHFHVPGLTSRWHILCSRRMPKILILSTPRRWSTIASLFLLVSGDLLLRCVAAHRVCIDVSSDLGYDRASGDAMMTQSHIGLLIPTRDHSACFKDQAFATSCVAPLSSCLPQPPTLCRCARLAPDPSPNSQAPPSPLPVL